MATLLKIWRRRVVLPENTRHGAAIPLFCLPSFRGFAPDPTRALPWTRRGDDPPGPRNQRGTALLNAVLLLITFALLAGLMSRFLVTGLQGTGEQAQASQAYYLAISGASCIDGNQCPSPGELTFGENGTVTLNSPGRVTATLGGSTRILEKGALGWREVAN